jgi:prepilin-type N-terminal cleavage/methylation domain-containing protein
MLNRTRKGLTLLELIVVIVILGILSAIAIPTFLTLINDSKTQSAKTTAFAIASDANGLAAFDQGTSATALTYASPDAGGTAGSDVTVGSNDVTYFDVAAGELTTSGVSIVENTDASYTVTVGGGSYTYTG